MLHIGVGRGRRGRAGAGAPVDPPVIANQTLAFGRLTKATRGGVAPDNTGGTVTSASITTDDATNPGHFTIASDGTLSPTASYVASPAASYSLVCTFTNSGGSDAATITIPTEANVYDFASQADWDDLMNTVSAATFAGKTVKGRRGSLMGTIASGVNGVAGKLRRNDYGGLIVTSRHTDDRAVFDTFTLRGTRNVTFDAIATAVTVGTKFNCIAESANHLEGITIRNCLIQGTPVDPNGDYEVAGSYPNADMIVVSGGTANWIGDITIKDNDIIWCSRGINCQQGKGTATIIRGNRISYFYEDGIQLNYGQADIPAYIEDNVLSHPIGVGTDGEEGEGPHVDVIRLLGSPFATTDWTVHINRNRLWHGDARGDFQFFLASDMKTTAADSGHFFIVNAAGNVMVGNTTVPFQIENAKDCVLTNNTVVNDRTNSGTPIGIIVGAGSTDATSSGTHILTRNIAEQYNVAGTETMTDNITLGAGGATIAYTTVFEGDASLDGDGDANTWNVETLEELMAWYALKAAGPADLPGQFDAGAIGSGYVNWASTVPGSDGSFVAADTGSLPAIVAMAA